MSRKKLCKRPWCVDIQRACIVAYTNGRNSRLESHLPPPRAQLSFILSAAERGEESSINPIPLERASQRNFYVKSYGTVSFCQNS